MPLSQTVNIALCFSNPKEARGLSEKLKEITPNIHFVISANFDEFLKDIAKKDKIDCFIIEDEFSECSAVDLVNKLKTSFRYKKSVISIFSPDLSTIDKRFLELKTDYNFDLFTELKDVISNLKRLIIKSRTPVIPKNANVLVLDNSFEILELISMHLNELGHDKTDLCQSINEAKKSLLEKDYDLLLLDWNLDDGTCIDLIEFIQNAKVSARTKKAAVVVITGRDDVEDIMTLLRYGIKDHIIKPFDFNEFEDKVSYAIERHLNKV